MTPTVPGRSARAAARHRSPALLAAVLAAALALAGCQATPPTVTDPDDPPPATVTADLAAMKKAAGIADCPVSDPDVPVRADGLPDVTVSCLGGGRDVRLAGLRGRPLVVNVWAQWCPPCREEAPLLAEASRDAAAGDSDLQILGLDFNDPRPDYALEFAQLSGWTYPQLADVDQQLKEPLSLGAGMPQTFFVTADGRIAYRKVGAMASLQELRDLIRAHLGVSL